MVPLLLAQSKPVQLLARDAEFVALWVLHYGPVLAGYLVIADDRGTEPD